MIQKYLIQTDVLSDTDFKDGFAILKKGKKSYYKLQK